MELKKLNEAIAKMDKGSDEFFELYKQINDKYWDIDDPDYDQKCRQILNLMSNAGDGWHVEVTTKLANDLFKMVEQKIPAMQGAFGVEGKEYHFSFYTDRNAIANLEKMLRQTVMVKAKEIQNESTTEPRSNESRVEGQTEQSSDSPSNT